MKKLATLAFAALYFLSTFPAIAQSLPSPSFANPNVMGRLGMTAPNALSGSPTTVPWATPNGAWFAPTWNVRYYGLPDFGSTTPVYTQGLLKCAGTETANTYQSCFGVEMLNNTGAAPPWTASTAYPLDSFTQVNGGKVYKVTTAGTSGASEPTWPASGTVVDGTVTWTYQNDGQHNAKSGITASSSSGANGGNHWLFNPNCKIEAGFKSQLYCIELDVGNHSGFDWSPGSAVPGPLALWIGGATDNTSGTAVSVGSQNSISGKPAWYWAFHCNNALAAGQTCFEDWSNSVSALHTASFATKTHDVWLQASSQNGLYLNGTYSNAQIQGNNFQVAPSGAVTSGGAITSTGGTLATVGDNTRINMLTADNRGFRAFNTSSGTTLGSLIFQGTTDNFISSFATSFSINGDGTVSMDRLTVATLPACNGGNAGKMTVISNGIASPTYLQTVSTTGSTTRKVFCDGSNWQYD
jgi:hypothetical protein